MKDWQGLVGTNVRKLRVAKGLSQERLAFAAEIDLTYMGGIERGKRNPSLLVLVGIANALGCEPADLLAKPAKMAPRGRKAATRQSPSSNQG
jgi:transcriptional regulator with XRE-family HTH domain